MTLYPTIDEVIAVDARLIAAFGGSRARSGVARPQTGYYNDLIQEAAALWESLSQKHPFIDENKRTAVTVTAARQHATGGA